eukprot:TRINITY_DN1313_c0_g1_i1.p1 TRINITY_DN1313_c0_g1~~TRINITY_DN1313_c0_g1_i1.p1  ORF type:complete len:298 (+),score=49.86 TRINITY_DN1313_c0_g1_i1:63-956(+)
MAEADSVVHKLVRQDTVIGRFYFALPHAWWECVAEFLGTLFIVLTGGGSVCTSVLMGAQSGVWQVAIVWGLGVALAVHFTASISGGHLNPAVSLAMAIYRPTEFHKSKLWRYWIAQFLGGFLGGVSNYVIYGNFINHYENKNQIERGSDDSVRTAMIFGEYYPNPSFDDGTEDFDKLVSSFGALCIEGWGTGLLVFMILALTDRRNRVLPKSDYVPFLVGMTVAALIAIYAPLTQAGWNPARDFGPRVVAVLAGWGSIAIPGPHGGFWIYIFGPLLGGCIGGFLYEFTISRALEGTR